MKLEKIVAVVGAAVFFALLSVLAIGGIGPISTLSRLTLNPILFTNLSTSFTRDGQIMYCSDCTIANPCAGGGTGAIAKRLNGVNVCN